MRFTPQKDRQENPKLTYEVRSIPNRQQKFRELLLFIAKESKGDNKFGATKLNKIMHQADFQHFLRTGIPITGANYQRIENGPVPRALPPIREELIKEGALTISYIGNHKVPVALRDPDLSYFTNSELELVREIIKKDWNKTATQVSDESHGISWKSRRDGASIPYEAAYIVDGKPTAKDIARTGELVSKYGFSNVTTH